MPIPYWFQENVNPLHSYPNGTKKRLYQTNTGSYHTFSSRNAGLLLHDLRSEKLLCCSTSLLVHFMPDDAHKHIEKLVQNCCDIICHRWEVLWYLQD